MPENRGGLSVFSSMLRRGSAPEITDEEYESIVSKMRESEDELKLTEKMGTGKYWIDMIKHLPVNFLTRMKEMNPETGEIRWLGRAPVPDLDLVGKGLMTMEEWKAEKAAADEYNEARSDFRSTWVDDTKSMATLPALIGNVFGGDFEPPEFAVEAAQRVGEVTRATQEDFGVDDPSGFPQHLFAGAGAMLSQAPIPGGPARGALSQAVRKIPAPIRAPVGAVTEMINPTIRPSARTYLKGSVASGILDTALDPSDEAVRNIEDRQRRFDKTSSDVVTLVTKQWDEAPMDTKIAIFYTPFADEAWKNMNVEQREEIAQELARRGAFDDAE